MSPECEVQIAQISKLEVSGAESFLLSLFNSFPLNKVLLHLSQMEMAWQNFVQIVDKVMTLL